MEGDGLNLNSLGCRSDGTLPESQHALSSHGSTGKIFVLKLTTVLKVTNHNYVLALRGIYDKPGPHTGKPGSRP